jgi:hypothetical protein
VRACATCVSTHRGSAVASSPVPCSACSGRSGRLRGYRLRPRVALSDAWGAQHRRRPRQRSGDRSSSRRPSSRTATALLLGHESSHPRAAPLTTPSRHDGSSRTRQRRRRQSAQATRRPGATARRLQRPRPRCGRLTERPPAAMLNAQVGGSREASFRIARIRQSGAALLPSSNPGTGPLLRKCHGNGTELAARSPPAASQCAECGVP